MATNLTPNFTLEEMLRSDKATEMDFSEQFTPGQDIIDNLTQLCQNVLEPLRAKIGQPIIITSGYRCLRTNTAVGGANNSQHVRGQAADTHVVGMSIEDWYQFIKNSGIQFDQLIQEFGEWAHVSFNPASNQRAECLRATTGAGGTVYAPDDNMA